MAVKEPNRNAEEREKMPDAITGEYSKPVRRAALSLKRYHGSWKGE
jgi:hypothetical protein